MGASAGVPVQYFCPSDSGQDAMSLLCDSTSSIQPTRACQALDTGNKEEEEWKSPLQDRVGEGGEVVGGTGKRKVEENTLASVTPNLKVHVA